MLNLSTGPIRFEDGDFASPSKITGNQLLTAAFSEEVCECLLSLVYFFRGIMIMRITILKPMRIGGHLLSGNIRKFLVRVYCLYFCAY